MTRALASRCSASRRVKTTRACGFESVAWLREKLAGRPGRLLPSRLSRCTARVVGRFEKLAVGAVALAFQVVDRDEAQGGGVDAVAQGSGFLGTVRERVA